MNVAYASPNLFRSFFSHHHDLGRNSSDDDFACYAILHFGRPASTMISTLLHLMPSVEDAVLDDALSLSYKQPVIIHPTLLRVLLQSHHMTKEHGDELESCADGTRFTVQVISYEGVGSDGLGFGEGWLEKFSIEDKINSHTEENSTINLRYMCSNSEKYRTYFKEGNSESKRIQFLREKLVDTVVVEGTILGIDHGKRSDKGKYQEASFFMVDKVDSNTRSSCRYVRLPNMNCNITLASQKTSDENSPLLKDKTISQFSCPGYKSILEELMNLASFRNRDGRPTAVILSGCAGVGKSRMAFWLEEELSRTNKMSSVKVSVKDILLEETSSTFDESRVIDELGQTRNKFMLLVIDDIDVIIGESGKSDSKHESEQLRSMNAVAKLIDKTIEKLDTCFILGLCRSSWAELPIQLARVGRFEKLITMSSPTQSQRKDIFHFWFSTMPLSVDSYANSQLIKDEWTDLLTPRTAGCVAADIRRICADALTSALARAQQTSDRNNQGARVTWNDIKEAARRCIPSQLASLDVIPATLGDCCSNGKQTLKPMEEFDIAWNNFGGYHDEKRRLYRAIARPWKYHMDHADTNPCSDSTSSSSTTLGFSKPSGILFHGPSGCGKTSAALCLASSMGLHCVKVRASEIFNQWLGGSEATLRSIFSRARAASPCILFFDELDALAMNRDSNDSGAMSGVQSRILTTLLNEMDGITNAGGKQDILVVAATNRLDAIDAALLRPGRLEEHVLLSYPTLESIREILQLQTSKMPLDDLSVDLDELSRIFSASTCSCAEVEGICRDACLIAMRRFSIKGLDANNMSVTRSDFDEAFTRIKRGSRKS